MLRLHAMAESDRFLWFDTEFSTGEIERASILQASLMITDGALRVLQPQGKVQGLGAHERRRLGVDLHVALRPDLFLSEFIQAQTELLHRCRLTGRTIDEVDALLCAWVDAVCGPAAADQRKRPMLAGNSIHMDWYLVLKELPAFARRLHFRVLDVTALKMEWHARGGPKFDKDSRVRSWLVWFRRRLGRWLIPRW